MANPLGNLLQLLGLGGDEDYDDDYYEDDFEDDIDEAEERSLLAEEERRQRRSERKNSRRSSYEEDEPEPQPAPEPRRTSVRTASNKVVPIRTTARGLEVLGIPRMHARCFFRVGLSLSIWRELTLWKHRGSWTSFPAVSLLFPVRCIRFPDIYLYSRQRAWIFRGTIWSCPEMMNLGFRH